MKAKGVRLHAANDLRLEEFELPEITDDEILVKVVSDSICMSTYKCAILGIMLCSGICCCNTVQCYSRKRWMPELFRRTDRQKFSAEMNFYDVHYNSTHVMGTTGGNTADMIESLE